MKPGRWRLICVTGAAVVLGLFALRSFSFRMWEATLNGPYTGAPFTDVLPSHPVSSLEMDQDCRLSVYEIADMTAPVVVFFRGGEMVWSRVLVPQRESSDGRVETARLWDMQLLKLLELDGRPAVEFRCEWDWGGRERGLIYLGADYSFRHFRVSW